MTLTRYEVQDEDGLVIGRSATYDEGARMLQGFVLTSPGREHDIALVSLTADGDEIAREDIFDIDIT